MGIASVVGRVGHMIAPFTATVVCTLFSRASLKLYAELFVQFSLTSSSSICSRAGPVLRGGNAPPFVC